MVQVNVSVPGVLNLGVKFGNFTWKKKTVQVAAHGDKYHTPKP